MISFEITLYSLMAILTLLLFVSILIVLESIKEYSYCLLVASNSSNINKFIKKTKIVEKINNLNSLKDKDSTITLNQREFNEFLVTLDCVLFLCKRKIFSNMKNLSTAILITSYIFDTVDGAATVIKKYKNIMFKIEEFNDIIINCLPDD